MEKILSYTNMHNFTTEGDLHLLHAERGLHIFAKYTFLKSEKHLEIV